MKIFIYAFNNPTYLGYQQKCLRKFIQEPFDLFLVDNAAEKKYSDRFFSLCKSSNINYLKNLKPDHSLAGRSHYSALQWSWDNIISKTEEIIIMMDHDTFPIENVSITALLGDALLAGCPQGRGIDQAIEYFHPCLMIFNTKDLPNKDTISFEGSIIDDIATDIGGDLCRYFRANPDVKKKRLRQGHIHSDSGLFTTELIAKYGYPHVFENIEDKFLHTRNGSGWERSWGDKIMFNRDQFIFEILNKKLL